MKAPFSEYLNSLVPGFRKLLEILGRKYEYVSILSTDSAGLAVRISQHSKSVSNRTMMTERGTVVRVMKDGLYSEYSMDRFDPEHPEAAAERISEEIDMQLALLAACSAEVYRTGAIPDEPLELYVEKETATLPEEACLPELVDMLTELSDSAVKMSDELLDCSVSAQSTHVCKLFMTENRFLRQSYVYSEGNVIPIASREGRNRFGFRAVSGLGGPELFERLRSKMPEAVSDAIEMLGAERIVPGEYEIITSPEISGLIAHEAFGHGVEMDMFVKGRALGAEYIGKRVGSELVTMHEGALSADNVASYAFDDEGTPAGDVTEIDRGILKSGICDALSAVRLGTAPTGNGKRQNFEHKVYTRMTNTIFSPGTDTLEDMIRSVKYGYLLEGMESGMEDPKHWGIQCILQIGREIRDGRLTGKIVSPVIMTGYVPDLLSGITMAGGDVMVFGSGGCGKGHKEWVKVSDGGPYFKTTGRLG